MSNGSANVAKPVVGILMEFDETWMGGVNYIVNLLNTIQRLPPRESPEICVITRQSAAKVFDNNIKKSPFIRFIYLKDGPAFARFLPGKLKEYGKQLSRLIQLNKIIRHDDVHILFPVIYAKDLMLPGQTIGWIPDLQHKHLPEFFTERQILKRDAEYTRFAERADYMVFSSNTAKKDFERFYPNYKSKNFIYSFCTVLDRDCDIKSTAYLEDKYGIKGKFIYLPNQFWAHKNHLLVFETIARLQEEGHNISLVCTGSSFEDRNRDYYKKLMNFLELHRVENIMILGLIPRQDQLALYYHSRAVLQPSLFEGWSSIVEDARAFDKTIILSDIPVHREQSPPGARFFDPLSHDDLAQNIIAIWDTEQPPVPEQYDWLYARQEDRVKEAARSLLEVFRKCGLSTV